MDDLFPFEVFPSISPRRPQPRLPTVDDSSDDEFALPSSSTKKPLDPATASDVGSGSDLQAPSKAGDPVDGGSSLPGEEAASAEAEVVKEVDNKVDNKVNSKVEEKIDQKDFESFPQVKSQKDNRWGSIAKEELVWYQSFPALVVPPVLHLTVNSDIKIPTHDGVMTYGPRAKGVKGKRYVILQYLPLCCSSAAKPGCPFIKVAGIQVEKVLPYNTKMGKNRKQAGEDGEFGPEEVWADTKHHFKIMKQKKTQLTSENWDVAMEFAQKYLDRALELEKETAEADRLEKIEVEEARRLEKEEKEKEDERRRKEGVDGGGGVEAKEHAGDCNAEAAAPPPSVPIVESRNLKLSPGDSIFFLDQTRIAGTAAARKTATILAIRTKDEAKEWGVGRLVLDRNQIIDDDCAIRKFVKNKKTGKMELDHRRNIVRRYKLIPGKVEGVDVGKDSLMEGLVSQFKQDMRDHDYGDQLREAGRGEVQSASDSDDAGQSGDESEAEAEAAIPAARKRGSPVRVSDAGGRGDDDSDGDAIAASIMSTGAMRRQNAPEQCDKGEGSEVVRPAAAAKGESGGAAKKKNKKKAAERTEDDGGEGQGKEKGGGARASKSGGGRKEVDGNQEPKKRKLSKLEHDEVDPNKRKSAKLADDKAKPGKRKLSKSDAEENEPKKRKSAKRSEDEVKSGKPKLSKSDGEENEPKKRKSAKRDDDEPTKRRSPKQKPAEGSEEPQTKRKIPASKKLSKGENDKPKQRRSSKEKASEGPKAKGKSPASKAAPDESTVKQRKRKSGGDEKVPSKKDKREPGRQKSDKGEPEPLQRKGKPGEEGAKPKAVGYSIPKKKNPPQGEGQSDGVRSPHAEPGPRTAPAAPSTIAVAGHGGLDEKPR